MAWLPRFVVLKSSSNHKCLSLTKDIPLVPGLPAGFMSCNTEQVVNPKAKFEVERASTGTGLVHIRCCYNNKYWVTYQTSRDNIWIVASADKPEEDQSKSSCTLFEPRYSSI